MNRLLHSILLLVLGQSVIDDLAVGESTPVPPGRLDKDHKKFRVEMIVHREA